MISFTLLSRDQLLIEGEQILLKLDHCFEGMEKWRFTHSPRLEILPGCTYMTLNTGMEVPCHII